MGIYEQRIRKILEQEGRLVAEPDEKWIMRRSNTRYIIPVHDSQSDEMRMLRAESKTKGSQKLAKTEQDLYNDLERKCRQTHDTRIDHIMRIHPYRLYKEKWVFTLMERADTDLRGLIMNDREYWHNDRTGEKHLKDLLHQICNGLSLMHENNYMHLDLKPHNILSFAEPEKARLKLGDYNGAKNIDGTFSTKQGTDVYSAPETTAQKDHHRTRKPDHRSDIFSLGAILYEMTHPEGEGLFWSTLEEDKPNNLERDKLDEEQVHVRRRLEQLKRPIERFFPKIYIAETILQSTHPDPEKRPQSTEEFWRLLTTGERRENIATPAEKRAFENAYARFKTAMREDVLGRDLTPFNTPPHPQISEAVTLLNSLRRLYQNLEGRLENDSPLVKRMEDAQKTYLDAKRTCEENIHTYLRTHFEAYDNLSSTEHDPNDSGDHRPTTDDPSLADEHITKIHQEVKAGFDNYLSDPRPEKTYLRGMDAYVRGMGGQGTTSHGTPQTGEASVDARSTPQGGGARATQSEAADQRRRQPQGVEDLEKVLANAPEIERTLLAWEPSLRGQASRGDAYLRFVGSQLSFIKRRRLRKLLKRHS